MNELNQLRQLAGNDPETAKEVQDLIRTMQRLDPSRFPGNPEMVEQLHTEVMSGVDKLELQLRRDGAESGQVRTDKPLTVPPGYQEAVAEYYRRLGKGQ
jgi:septation ring formation regulator EzrA